jgi:hypothetical protein
MFKSISHICLKCRCVWLSGAAAGLLLLGLSGCSSWNLRGDNFPDDSMTSTVRKTRQPANKSEFWGFSNKARQIEEDCGGQ